MGKLIYVYLLKADNEHPAIEIDLSFVQLISIHTHS